MTPSITELVFAKIRYCECGQSRTEKMLLDNKEDTSSWTTDSKQAYDAAIAAGQKVYDSEHASKGSVDSAVLAIKNCSGRQRVERRYVKIAGSIGQGAERF